MSGQPAGRPRAPRETQPHETQAAAAGAMEAGGASRLDPARILSAPALEAVRTIGRIAASLATPIYFVGGVPRDLVLGRPAGADLDIVAVGDAVALAEAVRSAAGGTLTLHRRFGTATWHTGSISIDIVTARSERYARPAALPEVSPGSLDEDLARRDFTVNTLALPIVGDGFGAVFDRHGGRLDLAVGVVRALHAGSFVDDPTRIFRAVRTEVRFDLRMEPATERWARDAVSGIRHLSGARVLAELRLLIAAAHADRALERLADLGVLRVLGPEPLAAVAVPQIGTPLPAERARVADAPGSATTVPPRNDADDGVLAWLAANGPPGVRCGQRLQLSATAQRDLAVAVALARAPELASAAAPTSIVNTVIARHRPTTRALALAAGAAADATTRERLAAYAGVWRSRTLPLDGDDVIALGVPTGAAVGRMLDGLRAAWWDGAISDREAAVAFVRRRLGEVSGSE